MNCRIKLPLGIHRLTGSHCQVLAPDGLPDASCGIGSFHRGMCCNSQAIQRALQSWPKQERHRTQSKQSAAPASQLGQLHSRCAVLKALETKAKQDGHLKHVERTVLRGILGPLGKSGAAEIHRIIGYCKDYDRRITERMITSAPPKAMGCKRIQEVLDYLVEDLPCDCRFSKKKDDYAHPLRHLQAPARQSATPEARTRQSTPPTPRSTPTPSPADAAGTSLEALLREFSATRKRLMQLQEQIRAGINAGQGTALGTPVAAGPDPHILAWRIPL